MTCQGILLLNGVLQICSLGVQEPRGRQSRAFSCAVSLAVRLILSPLCLHRALFKEGSGIKAGPAMSEIRTSGGSKITEDTQLMQVLGAIRKGHFELLRYTAVACERRVTWSLSYTLAR